MKSFLTLKLVKGILALSSLIVFILVIFAIAIQTEASPDMVASSESSPVPTQQTDANSSAENAASGKYCTDLQGKPQAQGLQGQNSDCANLKDIGN